MKKRILPLIISIFILLLLAMTNPTKAEYTSWLKEQYISHSTDVLEKGVFALFGNGLIDGSTNVKNFVFFSTYTTSFDAKNNITVVGLSHNFIQIQSQYIVVLIYIVFITVVALILLLITYQFLVKK